MAPSTTIPAPLAARRRAAEDCQRAADQLTALGRALHGLAAGAHDAPNQAPGAEHALADAARRATADVGALVAQARAVAEALAEAMRALPGVRVDAGTFKVSRDLL